MIRLSKLSDYAIVVLSELAQKRGQVLTASSLAQSTHIPEPTVAKVLKLLSRADIIHSTRGVNGGYSMDRDPALVTIHELIVALEGPVAITACTKGSSDSCSVESICAIRGGWQKINDAITNALDDLCLVDLFMPFDVKRATDKNGKDL
jgi:FeS assembly SUF system regulator